MNHRRADRRGRGECIRQRTASPIKGAPARLENEHLQLNAGLQLFVKPFPTATLRSVIAGSFPSGMSMLTRMNNTCYAAHIII